jgi:hypothetical protein
VRENRTHGSMRRREATPDQSARPRGPTDASRRPYVPAATRFPECATTTLRAGQRLVSTVCVVAAAVGCSHHASFGCALSTNGKELADGARVSVLAPNPKSHAKVEPCMLWRGLEHSRRAPIRRSSDVTSAAFLTFRKVMVWLQIRLPKARTTRSTLRWRRRASIFLPVALSESLVTLCEPGGILTILEARLTIFVQLLPPRPSPASEPPRR